MKKTSRGGTDNSGRSRAPRPPRSAAKEPPRLVDRKPELAVAILLSAGIVCFHVVRLLNGGGLWRDEAATAHLAENFSLKYVIENSQHELFPALGPSVLHAYSVVAGNSDIAMRSFGLLVGLAILAALWWNMWVVRRSIPLLSLALLGFNGVFIQWTDAVRSYGLGIFFILLSTGAIWLANERQTIGRIAATILVGVLTVQCLFNNAVLLFAVCSGAIAVTLRRGARWGVVLMLGVLTAAAVSLLPYWGPLRIVRQSDMMVRWPISVESLWVVFSEALSGAGEWSVSTWVVLFSSGLFICVLGQLRRNPLSPGRERSDRDLLLFSATVCVVAVVGYFGFLKSASYLTRPWYYLALMGLVALHLDFVFDTLRRYRWARYAQLAVVLVVVAVAWRPTWRQVQVRQTNVDLVAAKLEMLAAPQDLIIITPWYIGVSFDRYYGGPAAWLTLPPIESNKVHRYDLLLAHMTSPDQNEPTRPVFEKISETLSGGHRVWVAGRLAVPAPGQIVQNLSPAPDPNVGWHDDFYSWVWSAKTWSYLERARRKEAVPLEFNGPVNPFENLPLTMFEGW